MRTKYVVNPVAKARAIARAKAFEEAALAKGEPPRKSHGAAVAPPPPASVKVVTGQQVVARHQNREYAGTVIATMLEYDWSTDGWARQVEVEGDRFRLWLPLEAVLEVKC